MKATIVKATRFVVRFLGPVAGSVQGELCKEERQRVLVKMLVMGVVTGVPVWSSNDSEYLTDLVIPVGVAALTGVVDAKRRLNQGETKPPEDAPPVPPSAL